VNEVNELIAGAHWFIDENKSNGLMLLVVAVPPSSVGSCRAQMAKLAKEPPRKGGTIHFHRELDGTRSKVLRKIATFPVQCSVIHVPHTVKPVPARERAVRHVGQRARIERPHRIVFELDEAAVVNDRKWLSSELPKNVGIEYQHLPASADPMLWIPDAVAWAIQRGGQWRAMIENVIVSEIWL